MKAAIVCPCVSSIMNARTLAVIIMILTTGKLVERLVSRIGITETKASKDAGCSQCLSLCGRGIERCILYEVNLTYLLGIDTRRRLCYFFTILRGDEFYTSCLHDRTIENLHHNRAIRVTPVRRSGGNGSLHRLLFFATYIDAQVP
jgi:hypothetical protein